MDTEKELLQKYTAPEWCQRLRDIPRYFVKLAQVNTPVSDWNLQDVPNGFKVGIKRDDMTGITLSGNKVRKLEFFLGDAISQNCNTVITSGKPQSNHCRTTSIAARQLGLETYLVLKAKETADSTHGNSFLMSLTGSHVITVDYKTPDNVLHERMVDLAEQLRREQSRSVYVVPHGGSSHVGMFGYIKCFQEMIEQNVLENYTDIFVTSGTTGTASSLAVANYLTGSKLKVHAVSIHRDVDYSYRSAQKELDEAGLSDVRAQDILDIMMAYQDLGYGKSTREELDDIKKIASTTGILLDPNYTVKTVRRMLIEMRDNPQRFKGKNVLFIHTGGLFGLFDSQFRALWNENNSTTKISTLNNNCILNHSKFS